jgi:hypothetical protein
MAQNKQMLFILQLNLLIRRTIKQLISEIINDYSSLQ